MKWFYRTVILAPMACPACDATDFYINYAAHDCAYLRCNACGKSFDSKNGRPDPRCREAIEQAAAEATELMKELEGYRG